MTRRTLVRVAVAAGVILVGALFLRMMIKQQEHSAELEAARERATHALEIDEDPEAALRLTRTALQEFPDDAWLLVLSGRAYHGRGRLSQAIEAFEQAARASTDSELDDQLRYYSARSLMCRFLETRDREDFNRAAADLRVEAERGSHQGVSKVLLGLALAEDTPMRDPANALRLIREGLASDPRPQGIGDLKRIHEVQSRLVAESGGGVR